MANPSYTDRMKQLFHHYETWEEFTAGMWRLITAEESRALLIAAVRFTGDHVLYGSYMRRIILEWPISCEQNLTNVSMNRRAWVGHAACCLATGSPEYVTRQAWKQLTQQQQDAANGQADRAIRAWESQHEAKNSRVDCEMGVQGLLPWDSR